MKKHNSFKVVMIVLLMLVLVSWFFPVTTISGGEFVKGDYSRVGIFSLFSFFAIAIQYFSHIALYVISIGALYGVLHKIPAYRKLLDKIVDGFSGFEYLFMAIIMVVFALLSSMAGLSLPILLFFPFVISVILMMGYDKITAAMVTIGSVSAGMIGAVFSTESTSGVSYILNLPANEQVLGRIILLVVSLAIVFLNVFLYSRKHRDTTNLVEEEFVPEKTKTKKSIWPIVIVLDLVMVVLGLAFFSWDLFGIDFFTKATDSLVNPNGSSFTNGLFTAFNAVLGITSGEQFGAWTLIEASVVVFLATGLLAIMYKQRFNDYLTNMANGAKKAVKPALLVLLIYTVLVFTTNVPIQYTLTQWMMSIGGELNVIVMVFIAIIFLFLGVDSYYGTKSAVDFLTTVTGSTTTLALIWQTMYGYTMLFVPTSLVLMLTLSYLNISYGKWLKVVWPLLIELLAAIVLLLYIL